MVASFQGNTAQGVPILANWWGCYPVAEYNSLPEMSRQYLSNLLTFLLYHIS
jgi:hypothetical protein